MLSHDRLLELYAKHGSSKFEATVFVEETDTRSARYDTVERCMDTPITFARAVEAEVRKQDEALIRQLLDALGVATTPLAKDRQEVLRAIAAGRARKPLTDEQIEDLPMWGHFIGLFPENRKEIVRAIEAAHNIK